MTGRAKNGQKGESGRLADDSGKTTKRQKPLPFIMSIVHDSAQPMALRAQMAKAALPFLHKRGEEIEAEEKPKRQTLSDFELARRIAHILARGKEQVEREKAESLIPPREAGRVPSASEAGGVLDERTPPGALRAPPSPEGEGEQESQIRPIPAWPACAAEAASARRRPDDERAQHNDPLDPHPGYRWI